MKNIHVENEDNTIAMTLSFGADGSYVIYYYTEEMVLDKTFMIKLKDEDFSIKMVGIADAN